MQMDLWEFINQQQTDCLNHNKEYKQLFTDQAAENASRQFNASSQKNQRDDFFFANLKSATAQFNAHNQMLNHNLMQVKQMLWINLTKIIQNPT